MTPLRISGFFFSLFLVSAAHGQLTVPGADGSNGTFSPAGTVTIDLANSPDGAWDGVNPDPGTPLTGVYDGQQWAVVFRFTSVNIPSGVTVNFTNHPKRAPVVWLVSGSVTIAGTVNLSGVDGHPTGGPADPAQPGPGGFRGGRGQQGGTLQSAGYGPGGAPYRENNTYPPGPSYGGPGTGASPPPTYGNAGILPLVGGSGATGFGRPPTFNIFDSGGGAGGGALLIACSQSFTLSGAIRANGGSGGAVRIVANSIGGSGNIQAIGASAGGNYGGNGRIRLESPNVINLASTTPVSSQAIIGPTAQIWPPSSTPSLRIVSVRGVAAPADPVARLNLPADVTLSDPFPLTVVIEAANMPLSWLVRLRLVPVVGADMLLPATFASGDATLSTWQVQAQLLNGFTVMQASAAVP